MTPSLRLATATAHRHCAVRMCHHRRKRQRRQSGRCRGCDVGIRDAERSHAAVTATGPGTGGARPPASGAPTAAAPAPAAPVPGAPRPFAEVDQGRQAHGRPLPALAEGRQDVDRDSGEPARQAVLPVDQHESRHRRADAVCRADGQPVLRHRRASTWRSSARRPATSSCSRATRRSSRSPAARKSARCGSRSRTACSASAPVASLPHPERKSVLIDANALLMTDIPRASNLIERMYRNSYSFDRPQLVHPRRRRPTPDRTVIDVTAHYAQPRIPVPPPRDARRPADGAVLSRRRRCSRIRAACSSASCTRSPSCPSADGRRGWRTRESATSRRPRSTSATNRSSTPVRFYVNRWRLEKKDPNAAVSEPVKPITFWLSNEIPEKHREPIRLGILEWNKAFEKVGFTNAVVVRQQPDDADFDLGETQYASIRWMATATPSFGAIGPSQVDPRTRRDPRRRHRLGREHGRATSAR